MGKPVDRDTSGRVVAETLADRLLIGWTAWVVRHYILILVLSLVLSVFMGAALSGIQVSTDIASLLPDKSPALRGLYLLQQSFDAARVVGVARSEEVDVTEYTPYLDLLVERLEEDPMIKRSEYRILDEFPTRKILPFLPLLLNEEEFEAFAAKLEEQAIRDQIAVNKRALVSVPSPAVTEILREDPLMLLSVLLERVGRGRGGFQVDVSGGYFTSKDGKTLLFFLWPTGQPDDLDFDKALLARLKEIQEETRREYVEQEYGTAEDLEGLEVGFTGPHLIAAIESNVISREGQRAVVISLVGVLILFSLAFRRIGSILYVGLPLVMGVLWSLGFSYMTVGELNLVTSGFAAIVLGLGVDFAIHLFNRFLDHRAEDFNTLESLEVSMIEAGKGVLTGGLTTAGAFFAMTLYDFKGIREFGMITGTGILFCLLAMFTVLPATLVARSRWRKRFHYRKLFGFFMEPLGDFVMAHWKPVLAVTLSATVVLGLFVPGISWSSRVGGDERYKINEAVELQRQVRETFGGTFKNLILLLRSRDLEALEDVGRELQQRTLKMQDQGLLSSAESIWAYMLPPEEQMDRLASLEKEGITWNEVRSVFESSLVGEGFRTEAFVHYEEALASALGRTEAIHARELLGMQGIPLIDNYLVQEEDGTYAAALYLYPRTENFIPDDLDALHAELRDVLGEGHQVQAFLVGEAVLGQELKDRTRTGFFAVTVLAFTLILGVLFLHFRNPVRVILALTPLASSLLWLLGWMSLTGVEINVMNVAVTPMLLGIGIDDAVHILNSYLHEAKSDLHRVFVITGKGVALTTLTTCIGFGSLAFADHPGLASMGTLAIWGVTLAFVSTVTLMPALMLALRRYIH